MSTAEIVHFVSLGYGELRLAKKYATKEILERLFQSESGIIVVDPNGEEVFPPETENAHYDIDSSLTYTVVSEEDLLSDTEDDDDDLDQDSDPTEEEYKDDDNIDDDDDLLLADEADNKLKIQKDVKDPSTSANEESHRISNNVDHSSHECQHQHNHNHHHHHEHDNNCCDNNHSHHHEHDRQSLSNSGSTNSHANNGFNKLLKMREERIKMIKDLYIPLHPNIFKPSRDHFEESFIKAVDNFKSSGCKDYSALDSALTKLTETRIYSLKIFNRQFCEKLREEVEHFRSSGLPSTKPNSMNNYGVIMDEIGFTDLFTDLRENYIKYFTAYLYPDYHGASIDSHHAFIVQYKMSQDRDLGFHYDESDVTVNMCLSENFTGSSLYFKGILEKEETHNENFEYNHAPGQCIIHIGHHRHGANGLTGGERCNLILWLRSINGGKSEDICATGATTTSSQ